MQRVLSAACLSLGLLVPAFAMAQTAGNGLLSVYVQVINPQGGSYYYPYGMQTRYPADFSVTISGNNPSPATFFGSQSGVQASISPGTYAVNVTGSQYNYSPGYSQGCSGTMSAGGTALCIITMSPTYATYSPYSTPYPYPYVRPSLSCQPQNQTVGLYQSASFTAVGGVGGTYNWRAGGRDYPNAGPVLNARFEQTGSQLVVVTNANLTATCEVTVAQGYYLPTPASVSPVYPSPQYPTPTIVNPTYYPRLPNTGVEPMTAAQAALALSLLGAAAAVAAPYTRKAFAIVTR